MQFVFKENSNYTCIIFRYRVENTFRMSDMTQLWHSSQDSVIYISGNTDKNKNNHKNLYDHLSLADNPIGAIKVRCKKKERK
jgi:hypothetical protein